MSCKIMACCISEKKGTVKKNVFSVKIIENYGIENDAHAEKDIIRQVSLISKEKIDDFKKEAGDLVKIEDGAFVLNGTIITLTATVAEGTPFAGKITEDGVGSLSTIDTFNRTYTVQWNDPSVVTFQVFTD